MAQPVVLAVDDDGDVLEALRQALGKRYGADYQILTERSPAEGLGVLERLRSQDVSVAVVIADQWMPQLTGVEFLAHAHQLHPSARRMLLIGVLDRSVNEPMSQAMALGRIDGWLWKPWEPAEEHLYLPVSEQLSEWIRATGQQGLSRSASSGRRRAATRSGICWTATPSPTSSTRTTPRPAGRSWLPPAPHALGDQGDQVTSRLSRIEQLIKRGLHLAVDEEAAPELLDAVVAQVVLAQQRQQLERRRNILGDANGPEQLLLDRL